MARKRFRVDSKSQSKKSGKRCCGDNDRISQLPDDILVAILSFMPLKEAGRTSVLSSRWINLWIHISCLNFVGGKYIIRNEERCKYMKWVDCIIRSHKAVTLKEFRICCDLRGSAEKAVTRWLKFAFARHVQKLELDLSTDCYLFASRSRKCAFPEEFLTRSSGGAPTSRPRSRSSHIGFKSLKALSLKCVDVTGEAIQFFLRNCPLLETLVVDGTTKISNLEVCGPSLVLKHLELGYCNNLGSVKVFAPNLTSLIVRNVEGLLLENVPMLVDVFVNSMPYQESVNNLLPALSCCIFQLEILTLRLPTNAEADVVYSKFPEMPKLKKLVIQCSVKGGKSLMGLTSLIRASPYLQVFDLKLSRWGHPTSGLDREVKNTIKFPHHHLKVFKFSNYGGRADDVELVRYVSENCVMLEKIIMDPCYPYPYYCTPENLDELKEKQTIGNRMKKQIKAQVPQHIELLIL